MNRLFKKFSSRYFDYPVSAGFTIFELLAVFAIIGIMTSLGIAAYNSYNGTQLVQSSATDVVTMLNIAKSHSLAQVIPPSCGTNSVTGYQVDVTPNGQQYTLSAICSGKQILTTNNLPPNITFANSSTPSVFFTISDGTVATDATITITGFGRTKNITVSQTGSVSSN